MHGIYSQGCPVSYLRSSIDSVDELRNLDYDKDSNISKVLCHLGGTTAAEAARPGTKVSARAKDNLKLVIYYVKH
jgi:hypothetical protein